MSKRLRISIFCRNRPGLIQAITRKLTDLGCNLAETTFAVLGNGAEFTSICTVGEDREIWEFDSAILVMPELVDAEIRVHLYQFGRAERDESRANLLLKLSGPDRPGVLANLSEALLAANSKIIRLTTEMVTTDGDPSFVSRFSVWIEPTHATEILRKIEAVAAADDCLLEALII